MPEIVDAKSPPSVLPTGSPEHGTGLSANGIGGIQVVSEEDRTFRGWGTVQVVDNKGDLIPIEKLKPRLEVMARRGAGGAPLIFTHTNNVVGCIFNQKVVDYLLPDGRKVPGIMVEGRVFKDYRIDDEVWNGVKNKKIWGLSIGGRNYKEYKACSKDGACANVLDDLEPGEWSLAEKPVNPFSYLTEINIMTQKNPDRSSAGVGVEKAEVPQEEVYEVRVREPILNHFMKAGIDGKCPPCTDMIAGLCSTGLSEEQSLSMTTDLLQVSASRYADWYGKDQSVAKADSDSQPEVPTTQTESNEMDEEMKAFKTDIMKALSDIQKSVVMPTNEQKGSTDGKTDTEKSVVWPEEKLLVVKADITKAVLEALKPLVAEEIKKSVAAQVEEVKKAMTVSTGATSQTANGNPADIKKGALGDQPSRAENMVNDFADAWKNADATKIKRKY